MTDNESSDNFLENVIAYAVVTGLVLFLGIVFLLFIGMWVNIFLALETWIQLAVILFIIFCLIAGVIIALIERMSQNKTLTKLGSE